MQEATYVLFRIDRCTKLTYLKNRKNRAEYPERPTSNPSCSQGGNGCCECIEHGQERVTTITPTGRTNMVYLVFLLWNFILSFIFMCAKYLSPLALALSSSELSLHTEEEDGVCSHLQWKRTGGKQCSGRGSTPSDALSPILHALTNQESS